MCSPLFIYISELPALAREQLCRARWTTARICARIMALAPVAQPDRVSDSDSEGHRFDSCRVYHNSCRVPRREFLLTRAGVLPFADASCSVTILFPAHLSLLHGTATKVPHRFRFTSHPRCSVAPLLTTPAGCTSSPQGYALECPHKVWALRTLACGSSSARENAVVRSAPRSFGTIPSLSDFPSAVAACAAFSQQGYTLECPHTVWALHTLACVCSSRHKNADVRPAPRLCPSRKSRIFARGPRYRPTQKIIDFSRGDPDFASLKTIALLSDFCAAYGRLSPPVC